MAALSRRRRECVGHFSAGPIVSAGVIVNVEWVVEKAVPAIIGDFGVRIGRTVVESVFPEDEAPVIRVREVQRRVAKEGVINLHGEFLGGGLASPVIGQLAVPSGEREIRVGELGVFVPLDPGGVVSLARGE